ncbi:MAG: recombinase family protein [Candidatus Xenobiia bacterium LiM19]
MKVIGYTRVSTEEQATSGVSLQAQVEKLRAYASCYDLEIVEIIEDGGQSAKSLNRPGIQRALQMMRDGQASGLLVAKLDRLTRSIVDLNTLISEYFSEKSKYQSTLFSVADQVDTRSAGGRLVLNVLMSVAQWEREAIGERTKAALNYKKSQGVKLGRPEKQITDPAEIKTINYIRELRAQGLTFRAIAATLDAEGYKTSRGGKWAPQTVKNLIESEVA